MLTLKMGSKRGEEYLSGTRSVLRSPPGGAGHVYGIAQLLLSTLSQLSTVLTLQHWTSIPDQKPYPPCNIARISLIETLFILQHRTNSPRCMYRRLTDRRPIRLPKSLGQSVPQFVRTKGV